MILANSERIRKTVEEVLKIAGKLLEMQESFYNCRKAFRNAGKVL